MVEISKHSYNPGGRSLLLLGVNEIEDSILLHHNESSAVAFGIISTCAAALQRVRVIKSVVTAITQLN